MLLMFESIPCETLPFRTVNSDVRIVMDSFQSAFRSVSVNRYVVALPSLLRVTWGTDVMMAVCLVPRTGRPSALARS